MLVPPPRVNLLLYHGVLAPRAAWRSQVVPRAESSGAVTPATRDAEPGAADTAATGARGGCGALWAELMRRTFGFDVLACPRCGGRLRLIALIDQAAVIQRILRHLGEPAEVPVPRPSRAPPLFDHGWEDHADAFDPSASPRRSPRYAGGVPADAAGAARPEQGARRPSPPRPSSAGPAIRTVSMGPVVGAGGAARSHNGSSVILGTSLIFPIVDRRPASSRMWSMTRDVRCAIRLASSWCAPRGSA